MFSDAYGRMLEVLVEARRDRALTQTDVAAALGKPQSFVAKIEGGERRLDLIEFCVLAEAMGADPGELFSEVIAALPRPIVI
jgi:transcriptional regulator with XRE-family HTH domain